MFKSVELLVSQIIDPEEIRSNLVHLGYKKVKSVFDVGDFALRGEILDIFPAHYDCPIRITLHHDQIESIDSINLKTGKPIWEHRCIIILPVQISTTTPFSADIPINTFVDIKKGDYIVHHQHGIGRFLGITELLKEFSPTSPLEIERNKTRFENKQKPNKKEKKKHSAHLVVEYEGGDKLYIPRHDIHLVQKYVGFTKKSPKLNKLGSKRWMGTCLSIQRRIQQMAAELLHTQAVRASLTGHAFSKDTEWQQQFERLFPFPETPDQLKTTAEVKSDMESPQPMDRLLCGDVGYGKTEVAMRAVFKAVMDNKQVAILVPTTILAEQHFYNFQKRLTSFPVRVAMLSRFRTPKEQKATIRGLADGSVDIVIGTHRLLSKDLKFKDIGLLVIDEEQRFGVKAKEKLKRLRVLMDVLTLTATPIPRTLYMALTGARDMSVISTPPQDRVPVETQMISFDEEMIKKAIEYELKRKGQVFFLHNKVDDIDKIAHTVKRLVPHARVAIGHGQMPARLLEEIMLKFFSNEVDVLVCTTIVESGIDIPNANTLIVNRADRFGLADLHQLRGRVGRFKEKAFAYFIVPPKERLSTQSQARLKALEKNSDLGAGFQIAFEDLQIRGAGNLLGQEQHGYITAIGFDLYCRLLKESIEHLKNIKFVPHSQNTGEAYASATK